MFWGREASTLRFTPFSRERDSSSRRGTEPQSVTSTVTVPKAEDDGVERDILFSGNLVLVI